MGLLVILLTCLFFILQATVAAPAAPQPRDGCQKKCGSFDIPYPFGIGDGCHRLGFDIDCNISFTPPKPFIGEVEVLKMTPEQGLLSTGEFIAKDCYKGESYGTSIDLTGFPYKVSNTRNKFISIGCDTVSLIGDDGGKFSTGCASVCNDFASVQNGSCSGIGCCETSIPSGIDGFSLTVSSINNYTNCSDFSPCSYAFLADIDSFNFNVTDLLDLRKVDKSSVTLEWSIGNETCDDARKNLDDFACVAENSQCYDAEDVSGYRCKCLAGFEGNPYLLNGCQDIRECLGHPCVSSSSCSETLGNYTCTCRENMVGDGRRDGSGCKPIRMFPIIPVVIGITSAVVFVCANIFWSYWALKKRNLNKLKEKFFQQNGGFLLQRQISQVDGSTNAMKIFSSRELEEATDNFAEERIVGKGGFGTVYKGILPDGRIVAVKKSKITNEEQKEQFINEVLVLSQINHRNVVKLLGCCLETQVPLLIYEFIANGTLSHHIHNERCKGSLSLEKRLSIAVEVAEALAYLHTSASTPIIHRDIKCSNILLDDNYISKVSDFGMSRLVPFDQDCLNSLVQGTFGYLDPEYLQSGQFTDKSDVYSYGVVLVQLLTGEKVVLPTRMPGNGNLASYFISYCKENRLQEILENRIRDEGEKEQLRAIAEIAKKCLCVKREERPTMKEVSKDLEELMLKKHPWAKKNDQETDHFLVKPLLYDPELFGASGTFGDGESSSHPMPSLTLMR